MKPVANQNYHDLTIPYDAKVSWGAGDVAVSRIDVELWDPVNNVKLGMVTIRVNSIRGTAGVAIGVLFA